MAAPNDPKAAEDLSKKIAELTAHVASLEASITTTKPDNKVLHDTARAAYAEYGNQIRHFSTVRSTLTVFLVTAGMTAFAGYLDRKIDFLLYAGAVFAVAAILVCLRFSYLTEQHVLLYKDMWHLLNPSNGKPSQAAFGKLDVEVGKGIWPRVLADMMNWLLIAAALGFLACVWWTYAHRAVVATIVVWPDDLQ